MWSVNHIIYYRTEYVVEHAHLYKPVICTNIRTAVVQSESRIQQYSSGRCNIVYLIFF